MAHPKQTACKSTGGKAPPKQQHATMAADARRQDETRMEQQPAAAGGIPSNANEPIMIVVREQSGEQLIFRIKPKMRMGKLFESYADRKGVERSQLIFRLEDGTVIRDDEKPRDIGFDGNMHSIDVLSPDIAWLERVQNELLERVKNELDASRRQVSLLAAQLVGADGIVNDSATIATIANDTAAATERAANDAVAAIKKAADDSAAAVKRAADDSNEIEKAAKRQHNE